MDVALNILKYLTTRLWQQRTLRISKLIYFQWLFLQKLLNHRLRLASEVFNQRLQIISTIIDSNYVFVHILQITKIRSIVRIILQHRQYQAYQIVWVSLAWFSAVVIAEADLLLFIFASHWVLLLLSRVEAAAIRLPAELPTLLWMLLMLIASTMIQKFVDNNSHQQLFVFTNILNFFLVAHQHGLQDDESHRVHVFFEWVVIDQ